MGMRKNAGNTTDHVTTLPEGHGPWNQWYTPNMVDKVVGSSIYPWAVQYSATGVVTSPPVIVPPPVVVKTITSITIKYSDGTSETKP